jgi:hypothetical protein
MAGFVPATIPAYSGDWTREFGDAVELRTGFTVAVWDDFRNWVVRAV